jgi:hypothetical protein
MLVEICEEEHLPLPELNVKMDGWEIDALWREAKLAVELDGYRNHHTPAQLRRDRRKEMYVRSRDLTPIRYSEEQLKEKRQVARELRRVTAATASPTTAATASPTTAATASPTTAATASPTTAATASPTTAAPRATP